MAFPPPGYPRPAMDINRSALIVVDMLNPYEHEDADQLTPSVENVVGNIRDLVGRARDEGVDVIYVNDNYGNWTSSREELIDAAVSGERPDLVEPIVPHEETAFVIKARHSIFYSTPLEYLLATQGVDHLVLAGQVTEQCVLYSALDAYVRRLSVTVPRDAVAHIDEGLADAALTMMERNMAAELAPGSECRMVAGETAGAL
jgi:nicotinamidase-related amidase